jgi:hypothetical protein
MNGDGKDLNDPDLEIVVVLMGYLNWKIEKIQKIRFKNWPNLTR